MKKVIPFITFLLLLSCGPSKRVVVTPEMGTFFNYSQSDIRDVRLIPLKEGRKVSIFFETLNRSDGDTRIVNPNSNVPAVLKPSVEYVIERVITDEIYDYRDRRFVFTHVDFPFKFYIKYYADFWEGTGYERLTGEVEIELKEERNWYVKIYM
jgi:hypothetical protein